MLIIFNHFLLTFTYNHFYLHSIGNLDRLTKCIFQVLYVFSRWQQCSLENSCSEKAEECSLFSFLFTYLTFKSSCHHTPLLLRTDHVPDGLLRNTHDKSHLLTPTHIFKFSAHSRCKLYQTKCNLVTNSIQTYNMWYWRNTEQHNKRENRIKNRNHDFQSGACDNVVESTIVPLFNLKEGNGNYSKLL